MILGKVGAIRFALFYFNVYADVLVPLRLCYNNPMILFINCIYGIIQKPMPKITLPSSQALAKHA